MGVLGVLMNKDGSTTIKIRPELKVRLDQLGKRGESYSDIILRFLPLKNKDKKKTGEAI